MEFTPVYFTYIVLFLFGSLFFKKKNVKYYFVFMAILISVIAFYMYPKFGVYLDTVRFFQYMDLARIPGYGLSWIMTKSQYSNQPVAALYIYIISLLNNNAYIMAITAFLFYGIAFLWLIRCSNFLDLSKSSLIYYFVILLLAFNYIYITTGIRNFLAFMIFGYVLYIDILENKHHVICVITYCILCFLHPSCVLLLILRLILFIKSKQIINLICFILLIYMAFFKLVISIIDQLSFIPYFQELSQKVSSYFYGQSDYRAFTGVRGVLPAAILIILLLINVWFVREYLKSNAKFKNYCSFFKMLFVFVLGSCLSAQVFIRYTYFLLFMSLPLLCIAYDYSKFKVRSGVNEKMTSKIFLLIILNIIACIGILLLHTSSYYVNMSIF